MIIYALTFKSFGVGTIFFNVLKVFYAKSAFIKQQQQQLAYISYIVKYYTI